VEKVELDLGKPVEEKSKSNQTQKNILTKSDINTRKPFLLTKRFIDVLGSSIGLILTSPIMAWATYRIKKEEKGSPAIFAQERIGKDGKPFTMYKFRSMCVDAEERLAELLDQNEIEGAMFKIKDDPRVTKIGKILRKTSIDELPQLWNVLKGDMSLVGPRPGLSRELVEYDEYDMQRLLVKPGCSGLWQVSGRNDVHFKGMVDLDVEYIKNQSILNDIHIVLKTIKIMIKPNGAY